VPTLDKHVTGSIKLFTNVIIKIKTSNNKICSCNGRRRQLMVDAAHAETSIY